MFDEASGTILSGDLVFHDRAPSTPHPNNLAIPARFSMMKAARYELELSVVHLYPGSRRS